MYISNDVLKHLLGFNFDKQVDLSCLNYKANKINAEIFFIHTRYF